VLVTELSRERFEEIKELQHEQRSRFGEIVFRGNLARCSTYTLNADPPGNSSDGDGRSPSSTSA